MADMEKDEILQDELQNEEIQDEAAWVDEETVEEANTPETEEMSAEEISEDDMSGAGKEPQDAEIEEEAEDAESEDDQADDSIEEGDDKKKSLFKRKEKKDKSAELIADLNDKVKRQMAEFDNFRKRTEREKSQMYEIGAKSVIEKILPVVDNFERGLAAVPEESKEDGFVQGMEKIYKQMMTELENIGVKPIEAVGQEFNPDFHNAVMQVESEEYESGVVAQELQKGYMYRESVVRHSMVAVVQ